MLMASVPDRFADGIRPVSAMFAFGKVPLFTNGEEAVTEATVDPVQNIMSSSGAWLVVVLSLLSKVTEIDEPLEGLKPMPLLACAPTTPFWKSSQSFTIEVTSTLTYLLAVV